MRFSYFDDNRVTKTLIAKGVKDATEYRDEVLDIISKQNSKRPEYALAHAFSPALSDTLSDIQKQFKGIKHLVVIGIGGSNLGLEAIHSALGQKKVKLSVLDTIAPYEMDILIESLKKYKSATQFAVCVISKSGGTPETVVNTAVLIEVLQKQFGKAVLNQFIFIGNENSELLAYGKKQKATCLPMPTAVGGRYSVTTEVGLVPLVLLGHDVDSFISGVADAASDEFEVLIAEDAARLAGYIQKGYHHYNFFAFEKRLQILGAWYRQLFAESLGKAETKSKKPFSKGMLPTVTTATDLHSIGQLYLSGFPGVYTDFVTFDDSEHEHAIPKAGIGKLYGAFSDQEIVTAIYGGVVTAYQGRSLPYRSVIFDDDNLVYSLGLFMAMRMREVMYTAHLLDLNAFDQPNVELYKHNTKKILGL